MREIRFTTGLFLAFALLALLLGSVGVYGIMNQAVQRRRAEFGVRLALGATMGGLAGLILSSAGRLAAAGSLLGAAAALMLARAVGSQLFACPHSIRSPFSLPRLSLRQRRCWPAGCPRGVPRTRHPCRCCAAIESVPAAGPFWRETCSL